MFYPLNLFSVPPQAHVNRQAGGCFRQGQRFVMDPLVYYLTNYDDDDDDFDDDGDEAFQFAWSKLTARVA